MHDQYEHLFLIYLHSPQSAFTARQWAKRIKANPVTYPFVVKVLIGFSLLKRLCMFCSFQSIVISHCLMFFSFCSSAVGICRYLGDGQKTGWLGETRQWKLMGMRVTAIFHSDGHPSQLPSVAWQLWNVIRAPAWLNNVYISVCVCGGVVGLWGGCTVFVQMFTLIQQLKSLFPWLMRGRTNPNSWDLSCWPALHSEHRVCLLYGPGAANSLPDRAHCIITALMESRAERRRPDQSLPLR